MCVVCRDRSAKRSLTRVVRAPDGVASVDPTGKLNGRGAYLCNDKTCWERALTGDLLGKALKTTIDDQTKRELREFAERNFTVSGEDSRTAQEGIDRT